MQNYQDVIFTYFIQLMVYKRTITKFIADDKLFISEMDDAIEHHFLNI